MFVGAIAFNNFFFFCFAELRAAQVDVSTKELMVLPGQNATFMCRVGVPLQYCRVELPGSRNYNLNKGSVVSDVSIFIYCRSTDKSAQFDNRWLYHLVMTSLKPNKCSLRDHLIYVVNLQKL